MIDLIFTPEHVFPVTAGLFVLLLVAGAFLLIKKRPAPYERLSSILTPAEQHFYRVLSSALQGRALIFAKVRIADILKVRRARTDKDFWPIMAKIAQKHIDFVIVDPRSFTTLCLIELDDRSHARPERINRDRFINRIMAEAEIPLHRIRVARRYDRAELLRQLKL